MYYNSWETFYAKFNTYKFISFDAIDAMNCSCRGNELHWFHCKNTIAVDSIDYFLKNN